MTPAILNRSDDEAKARALMADLLPFLRIHKIGLFAREVGGRHRIALANPVGKAFMSGRPTDKPPYARALVREWRDFANVEMLPVNWRRYAIKWWETEGVIDMVDALNQGLAHFQSAIIPAPVNGQPTMLLCDGVPGNWRAYAVVVELDCYGVTQRGIKPQPTRFQ